MSESEYHQRQADHNRSQFGAYDYRTATSQDLADRARSREQQQAWDALVPTSGGSTSSGTSSGSGGGEGLAYIVLGILGIVAAYHAVIFLTQVYLHGVSPYVYFFKALTEAPSFAVLGFALAFLAAQVVPFFLLLRPPTILKACLYVLFLPAATVAIATAAGLAIDALAPIQDLRPAFRASAGGLPTDVRLPYGVRAATIASAMPVYIAGVVAFLALFFVLRAVLRFLVRVLSALLRRANGGFLRAWSSLPGRILLTGLATLFLILAATLVIPPLRMPLAIQTAPVVLVGLVCGWWMGGIAVALWLAAALVGLPVLADDTFASGLGGPYAGFSLGLVAAAALAGLRRRDPAFGHVLGLSLGANAVFVGAGMAWLAYSDGWRLGELWNGVIDPALLGLAVNIAAAPIIFSLGYALATLPPPKRLPA